MPENEPVDLRQAVKDMSDAELRQFNTWLITERYRVRAGKLNGLSLPPDGCDLMPIDGATIKSPTNEESVVPSYTDPEQVDSRLTLMGQFAGDGKTLTVVGSDGRYWVGPDTDQSKEHLEAAGYKNGEFKPIVTADHKFADPDLQTQWETYLNPPPSGVIKPAEGGNKPAESLIPPEGHDGGIGSPAITDKPETTVAVDAAESVTLPLEIAEAVENLAQAWVNVSGDQAEAIRTEVRDLLDSIVVTEQIRGEDEIAKKAIEEAIREAFKRALKEEMLKKLHAIAGRAKAGEFTDGQIADLTQAITATIKDIEGREPVQPPQTKESAAREATLGDRFASFVRHPVKTLRLGSSRPKQPNPAPVPETDRAGDTVAALDAAEPVSAQNPPEAPVQPPVAPIIQAVEDETKALAAKETRVPDIILGPDGEASETTRLVFGRQVEHIIPPEHSWNQPTIYRGVIVGVTQNDAGEPIYVVRQPSGFLFYFRPGDIRFSDQPAEEKAFRSQNEISEPPESETREVIIGINELLNVDRKFLDTNNNFFHSDGKKQLSEALASLTTEQITRFFQDNPIQALRGRIHASKTVAHQAMVQVIRNLDPEGIRSYFEENPFAVLEVNVSQNQLLPGDIYSEIEKAADGLSQSLLRKELSLDLAHVLRTHSSILHGGQSPLTPPAVLNINSFLRSLPADQITEYLKEDPQKILGIDSFIISDKLDNKASVAIRDFAQKLRFKMQGEAEPDQIQPS
ncbi:hypothetical protein A3J19_05145 [Candidatus Daviesbacteria bacterium RIFCSPLOWO2_02_FULL_41_8]|uniref:Uncharacterized protein n=3 Tax=Candidatus Daviesiibacteriota TaxID=1752718 RepID=A0A1F5NLH3_9BACT|nr:MAG: hypothetical protein A2871_01035 [Candidatus Daviesbacteria bacterium RIFCSPHIGHO2_01_FULL_41_23]OGE32629.1 MAG: hypothetical protein A3D83_01395 [Candidatus Daviesbacteria bacterium RIFCSPHIGHO2_02_FULL_41_10]OGE62479.1 MAG: hypothetical protein A2967_01520 [Candidatus Daviesbacteria bacterium RIFCSPLOWO2_01_FULL_41_32]OGE78519.1 MAG: hypothetical protein A3J19_05145 [Candidatus Daviesbacteria bacterium RIFCSPLOWO2_02_FULL_41_8]